MEFTTSPIAGAVAGHYLDAYFKTDPLLTIVMLIGGFIAGTVYLIQILRPAKDNS
jgi:F0F1-type ATP synthase assembly protein I